MSVSSIDVDVTEEESSELASSSGTSETSTHEKGFPRTCLLADCYLKKPKVFHNVDEYTKHVMRCMQQDDRRKAAAATDSNLTGDKAVSPRRQSTRITSVPLRVCLDHETPSVASSPTPISRRPASPSSDVAEVVAPPSATLPQGSTSAESSGTPSSDTLSVVTSSATPSLTTSSDTPSDVMSSETSSVETSSATLSIVTSSETPSVVTSSDTKLVVTSSETPSDVKSSETPSTATSSTTPSVLMPSKTPATVTSSPTTGSPGHDDFRYSGKKTGVAGGVSSVTGGGNDHSSSNVNGDVLEEEEEEQPVTTSDATISDAGDCDSFTNNVDKNSGVASGDSCDETEQPGRSVVSSNTPSSVQDTIAVNTSGNGESASSGERGRGRLQWTPAISARVGDGDLKVVEYTSTGRPTRKVGGRLANGESTTTTTASVAASSAGLTGSRGPRASSSSSATTTASKGMAAATRGRIAATSNAPSRAPGGRDLAHSTPASSNFNANGSVNGGGDNSEVRGKRSAAGVGKGASATTRSRASFGGASSGSVGIGTGGRSRRCSSGDVVAYKGVPAAVSSRDKMATWRGSLGSWGISGGFTCPVNALERWGLPGCGKVSRVRDTKCDSCQRVLRVDWQVGAAASIGSGVENPELKLAGEVSFESKTGITYMGKVVGIDPIPRRGAPRGVVRVKYDDWPYDRYDEDISMELVTPKGWLPTSLGRAGRRAIRPVKTFSPSLEPYYKRKNPSVADLSALVNSVVGETNGGVEEVSEDLKEEDSDDAEDMIESHEVEKAESGREKEEDKEAPRVKVWVCKHVRKGLGEPVNKLGQCKICYNAERKAKAGIKMCRHVREGEARACGRGPGDYGKGHCRECYVKKFPVKKVKVPRPRLWPSCTMPGCRRRHFGWTMCALCVENYQADHPEVEIQHQHQPKRKNGKSSWKYLGKDAEFTDSSEDEDMSKDDDSDRVPISDKASTISPRVKSEAFELAPSSSSRRRGRDKRDQGGAPGKSFRGKRGWPFSATRQAKRARIRVSEDKPTCFYCQKTEGVNRADKLLLCADFDCNRRVHMRCSIPPLDEAPLRFYCPLCIEQGKAEACEDPCMACRGNDRDDLMLVCDRDKCYRYFHCFCLPIRLDAPPKGEYVCPVCTGEDLEKGLVIAKSSGGVRPARGVPVKVEGDGSAVKVRRCSACLKRAVCATMWTCGSGKELCRGMTFHRKCLARGKPSGNLHSAAGAKASASNGDQLVPVSRGSSMVGGRFMGREFGGEECPAVGVWDSENNRLCCPECGYDLLRMDVADVTQEEQAYEGTSDQELAYKTLERALQLSLEDPRFGIGKTREMFEEPFKGSIGSGANRKAMYGSVFEPAVDLMFRTSKLTSKHKFLDIGCGIGSIVLQAAAWAGCQAAGVEIVEDRYEGAVTLHNAFKKAVTSDSELMERMHPDVIENKVHLFKGCFLEQWKHPEVRDADFIFFNNSSGWFNNSKALNNPDEHSLEARLLHRLKNDSRNNGKVLITLEHIAEWQPDCWERRTYKYSCDTKRAATYAANELEFWEYTVVSQWECPACTSLNTDAVNDCIVCGTYCRNKRKSKRL